jgi:hypothetical protein
MTAKKQNAELRDSKALATAVQSGSASVAQDRLQRLLAELKAEFEADKKRDLERQRNVAAWADVCAKLDAIVLNDEAYYRGDPELHAAFLELREAVAENRALPPMFPIDRFRGKTGKTKLGRPSTWRGYTGLYFARTVNKVRRERSCSIKEAIRRAVDHFPGLEDLRNVSMEALQVRYVEASKYWALFLNIEECDRVIAQHAASTRRMSLTAQQQTSKNSIMTLTEKRLQLLRTFRR